LLASGPAGIAFNAINRINVGNGHSEIYTLPPYHAVSEPRHIPSKEPAHGGYLIAMIDRDLAEGLENYRQEFWVFEADAVVKGPLAKIIVPLPGRQQIHGIWVSGDELREAGVWS
jgi:carotenoid cleavage dioxygenase